MQPLGSITVYFPFIDNETKTILKTTMEKASDYSDFVKLLKELALETDCSDLIVYFTIHHAAQLLDLKAIDLIGQKYPDIPMVKPNIGFARHFQGKTDDFENVIQSANDVLAANPADWLEIEMRFMRFEAETFNYPAMIPDSSNMETITDMISNDSRFNFYNTVFYSNVARIANIDGNYDEWERCNQIALDNAREHDDQIRLAYCLTEKALISSSNRVLARELLLEALEIMDILGSIDGYAQVLEHIGLLEMIRGEFTSSIENYLKVVSIREGLDIETAIPSLMLSSLYNSVGEYESGLDWGRMAEAQFENRPFLKPRAVMCQIWSLVLLNRVAEAVLILDSVHELILKSGRQNNLAWLHFVMGLIEFSKSNPMGALSSIEESLKIFEASEGMLRYQSMSLYYLAKIEVAVADENTEIFPYLALLEERALSEDLPGILGQALLLKSDVALIQKDDSTLRDIVQRLSDLTQDPRVSFLLPFVNSLLNRM